MCHEESWPGVYKHFFVWFANVESEGEAHRSGDLRGDCHILALIYSLLLFRTEKRVPHALSQERIVLAFYDNEVSFCFFPFYIYTVFMSATSRGLMFLLLRRSRNPSLVGHLCCIKHPLGLSSSQALAKHQNTSPAPQNPTLLNFTPRP